MAGRARGELPAGIYHVTTRTAGPIPMFADDVDRTWYCNTLRLVVGRFGLAARMFCLMGTHVHVIVETFEPNGLQTAMKSLNWRYAMWFNKRHGRSGHLVGNRYFSVRLASQGHLLNAFRYIARNPVTARMVERPEDWLWSTYAGCVGLNDVFDFVDAAPIRALFGEDRDEAAAAMRGFVTAA